MEIIQGAFNDKVTQKIIQPGKQQFRRHNPSVYDESSGQNIHFLNNIQLVATAITQNGRRIRSPKTTIR